jgi:hypothetical protein
LYACLAFSTCCAEFGIPKLGYYNLSKKGDSTFIKDMPLTAEADVVLQKKLAELDMGFSDFCTEALKYVPH